ncbi:hypothetical protein G9A89_022306 [Geosiphon pyriformis]|nr:hypothetical protein G9A89_022306 [Geosiphon pyriformis]
MSANAAMFSSEFAVSVVFSDLDTMWNVVHKIMFLSANKTFKKKWFKNYDEVFTKESSRYYKLELLVSKLIKASLLVSSVEFALLLDMWVKLDTVGTLVVKFLFFSGSNFDIICLALAKVRKLYCSSKLLEFRCAKESCIKVAVNKRIESFELDKDHIIRSILEHSFRKVVLDYLVVEDELVLEPSLIKSEVDGIMESWTRKCRVPLEYVFDGAFLDVMRSVIFDELLSVVFNLPEGKALVLSAWKEAWILIISKLYEWKEVLINTQLIVLIETAHKIFSKILSNRISLACSTYNVLCENNFSVLRSITMQSPIFAIGLVIENALEKDRELWLVL